MKRFTAILFLLPLLFNLVGYRLVIGFLQEEHHQNFTAQLDNDQYADEDLISIKTALSLPYYTATMDFERIDGAIRIDGVEYRYVKRRIVADSLELLCLPNTVKMELQSAGAEFFKIANDVDRDGTKKSGNISKTVIPEFCETLAGYSFQPFAMLAQLYPPATSAFISSSFIAPPAQPPEFIRIRC